MNSPDKNRIGFKDCYEIISIHSKKKKKHFYMNLIRAASLRQF